jgi:chromosome partitioning protein
MAKIVAIANQKGGVGKTTTAINLSSCLAHYGQETLLIDMDSQSNATSGLGIEKEKVKHSIYEVLLGKASIEDILVPTEMDWLDLIPANVDLIGAEVELVGVISRETRLKKALDGLDSIYKYILLDCPPSLGLLTVNSLTAAHSIIIPIQCEYYALEGLGQLLDTLRLVKGNLNPGLEIEGILLTMYDGRVTLSSQVVEEVSRFFKQVVYQTKIPRNVRLAEAPGFGKPVILYSKDSKGAQAYLSLTREFLRRNGMEIEEESES